MLECTIRRPNPYLLKSGLGLTHSSSRVLSHMVDSGQLGKIKKIMFEVLISHEKVLKQRMYMKATKKEMWEIKCCIVISYQKVKKQFIWM